MHVCQLGKRKAFLDVFFTGAALESKNQDRNHKENCVYGSIRFLVLS
jgi:hypothetical protein